MHGIGRGKISTGDTPTSRIYRLAMVYFLCSRTETLVDARFAVDRRSRYNYETAGTPRNRRPVTRKRQSRRCKFSHCIANCALCPWTMWLAYTLNDSLPYDSGRGIVASVRIDRDSYERRMGVSSRPCARAYQTIPAPHCIAQIIFRII